VTTFALFDSGDDATAASRARAQSKPAGQKFPAQHRIDLIGASRHTSIQN
jgi:hypothetical protein